MRGKELIRLVWLNITQNKFKVIMTSIGIIVGAATIVMVIAIGKGGQADVADQFKNLNAGAIDISYEGGTDKRGNGSGGEGGSSGGFPMGGMSGGGMGGFSGGGMGSNSGGGFSSGGFGGAQGGGMPGGNMGGFSGGGRGGGSR